MKTPINPAVLIALYYERFSQPVVDMMAFSDYGFKEKLVTSDDTNTPETREDCSERKRDLSA